MKRSWWIGAVWVASLLAAGCRSIIEVQVSELDGTWVASQARFLDPLASKQRNVDLIELGFEVVFVSPGDDTFDLIVEDDEGEIQVIEGTIEIEGPLVVLRVPGTEAAGEIFLEDDQLAFRLNAGLTFQYVPDGPEVPSTLLLVLDRISQEVEPL